ncbi:hypothetical protein NHX12_026616 [Muraenolepis orangiensis]|uniref:Uncharacterized protein n=1 Tax=Muraenolepis orangiensis TaxID=630683 RepID=A0A9Q0EFG1_9TELE|nr:hypothetical protein NHX12_026616 [Muraenolepis orangiensis]
MVRAFPAVIVQQKCPHGRQRAMIQTVSGLPSPWSWKGQSPHPNVPPSEPAPVGPQRCVRDRRPEPAVLLCCGFSLAPAGPPVEPPLKAAAIV